MAAKEIPGFYYNAEKRRYFRKQPTHLRKPPSPPPPPVPVVASPNPPSLFQTLRSSPLSLQPSTRGVYPALAGSVGCAEESYLEDGASYCGLVTSLSGRHLAAAYITADQRTCVCVYKLTGLSELCEVLLEEDLQTGSPYGNVMDFASQDGVDILLVLNHRDSCSSGSVLCRILKEGPQRPSWGLDLPVGASLTAVAGCPRIRGYSGWHGVAGLTSGKVAGLRSWTNQAEWLTPPTKSPVFALAFAPEGQEVFAGFQNGTIVGWDVRTLRQSSTVLEASKGRVKSSVISLHVLVDGNRLVSSALNSHLAVWDMRMERQLWQFEGHVNTYQPCSSAVGWDDSVLCASGSDSVLRVWSLVSGELFKAIPTNTLSHVALSASTSHQYHPAIFLASGERLQLLQP